MDNSAIELPDEEAADMLRQFPWLFFATLIKVAIDDGLIPDEELGTLLRATLWMDAAKQWSNPGVAVRRVTPDIQRLADEIAAILDEVKTGKNA